MPQPPATKHLLDILTFIVVSETATEELRDKLSALIEENKFALLQTYVYHEIVESKGFPILRKVFVFEICQAKVASEMLTRHPLFSVFMPCRIALYEENGKSIIATMNMDSLLESIKSDESLFSETTALFNSITGMMKELA